MQRLFPFLRFEHLELNLINLSDYSSVIITYSKEFFFFEKQSTGTFFAVARLAGATPPPTYVLSRGIGLQVGCLTSLANICCI